MTRRTAVTGLVAALLIIELVRRVFSTADCYVSLRYSPFLVGNAREELASTCVRRHLLFPFYL